MGNGLSKKRESLMAGAYFSDLRAFIGDLEWRGRLYRWRKTVNKDTELMPLMRLQYRGLSDGKRKVFLYEEVTGSGGEQYGMKVVTGIYGVSRQVLSLGMGCEEPQGIYEKWRQALAHPVEPVVVERGVVQEEVITGEELKRRGLNQLPAPVEEPGFSCGIRVTAPFITRDPESGIRNVGMYSGHFLGPDRFLAGIARTHHAMLYHHSSARRRGESLPVAVVLGALPDIAYVAAANLPYGVDELAVAGGIRGRAVEVVRCKTIPLEVPAEAEIVIEGEMSLDAAEPGEPFSDYPGYLMVERGHRPVVQVKAITHRKNAIFPAILVGLPKKAYMERALEIGGRRDWLRLSCARPGMGIRWDCGTPTMTSWPSGWRREIIFRRAKRARCRARMMKRDTSYELWMQQERVPVFEGYGAEDVRAISRKPWARTGGKGAFIQLRGMEGFTGMYVGEIPPERP